MIRTVWINVNSRPYPMRCTLGATEALTEKFGSLRAFLERLNNPDQIVATALDAVEILIAQGCAYENFFRREQPDFPDGGYKSIPREILRSAFTADDLKSIAQKIAECLDLGKKNEVSGKSVGKSKKK